MSRDLGFDPFSQFDFLSASFIYRIDDKKLSLDQATFVDLVSLHPFTFYDPQLSWRAQVFVDRIYQENCEFCHSFDGVAQMGFSLRENRMTSVNLLFGLDGSVSKHYKDQYVLSPMVSFLFLVNLSDKVKLGYFQDLKSDIAASINNNFIESKKIKINYFLDRENELGLEYFSQSKKGKIKNEFETMQFSFGHYF